MPNKTITINIVMGAIQVSSSSVRAKPKTNDTLCFKCPDGEFAVLYKNNRSPYTTGEKAVSGNKGQKTSTLKIRKLTAAEQGFPEGNPTHGGKFSYGVVVLDPATGNILTLDPDIIIDDPSGGGGGTGGARTKPKKKPTKKKKK